MHHVHTVSDLCDYCPLPVYPVKQKVSVEGHELEGSVVVEKKLLRHYEALPIMATSLSIGILSNWLFIFVDHYLMHVMSRGVLSTNEECWLVPLMLLSINHRLIKWFNLLLLLPKTRELSQFMLLAVP